MIKLFYSPGACSFAAHLTLEELKIPYEPAKVDLKNHTLSNNEDYYRINPQGVVPSLELKDGTLLTQNVAILMYLGDLDPQHKLMPPPNTKLRLLCHEWLGFLNSDVHKSFAPLFRPTNFVDSVGAQEELKVHACNNVKKQFNFIELKLKNQEYALGENFSVVDAYLYVFYLWSKHLNIPIENWPKYAKLIENITNREATKKILENEGLNK